MRSAVLALALLGCGRLGFDEGSRASDSGIDMSDAPPGVASCQARLVMNLGVQPIGDMGAAKTSTGYALGFVEAPSGPLWGTVLDSQLAPTDVAAVTTSAGPYESVTLTWTGANLLAGIGEPGGIAYLKRLEPDMSGYSASAQVTGVAAGPAFAGAGVQWYGGVADGTRASIYKVDGAGVVDLAPILLGTGTIIDAMSMASFGPFAAIAWSRVDACLISVVDSSANVVSTAQTFDCNGAQLAGGASLHLAYEGPPGIVYRTISVGQTKVGTASPERIVGAGARPQIITAGGVPYIGWASTEIELVRVSPTTFDPYVVVGLPAGPPNAWELVDLGGKPGGFAVYGSTLYAFDSCN